MFIRYVSKEGGLVVSDALKLVSPRLAHALFACLSFADVRRPIPFITGLSSKEEGKHRVPHFHQLCMDLGAAVADVHHRPQPSRLPPQTFVANFIQSPLVLLSLLFVSWGFHYLVKLLDPFFLPAPVRPCLPPLQPLSLLIPAKDRLDGATQRPGS